MTVPINQKMKHVLIDEIVDENRKTYDFLAQNYESIVNKNFRATKEAVEVMAPLIIGEECLDIGCGVGLSTKMLSDSGLIMTGIDISPKMIAFAKKRNLQAKFIIGDFLQYRFEQKFGGVFSMAFIHLFPKKVAIEILKKVYKLLNKGGFFYFGTTVSEKSSEGWEAKNDSFFPKNIRRRYRKHWVEEELEDILKEVGYNIVNIYHIDDPRGKVWMDYLVKK